MSRWMPPPLIQDGLGADEQPFQIRPGGRLHRDELVPHRRPRQSGFANRMLVDVQQCAVFVEHVPLRDRGC